MNAAYLVARYAPFRGCDVTARLVHTPKGDAIPIVELGADAEGIVDIALGNHADPADWLRTVAAEMLALAAQVDAVNAATTDAEAAS